MNLHHLKVFLAVAESGSISNGAARLFISQPAVTREIRDLEASIGLPLFDRRPRGVSLTEGGERLLQYAQRIFALEAAAERDLRGFASLGDGELRLGASATLGSYLLPELIEQFHQSHPTVVVDLAVSNTREVAAQLEDGRISLGFVEGAFDNQAFASHLLDRDRLLPVVGPEHPLAGRGELSARDLAGQDHYLREQGSATRASVEQAYRERGIDLRVRMSIGSTEALKRLVQDGRGIAWLSPHMVREELASGRLASLDVRDLAIEREFHALWRPGQSLSPAPAAFLERVRTPV
ncbi:LysR family transcriptional regulator [Pseudomonas sp. BN515]|uniref:LysR family transcriptional regulator n=1 Tax=Pseudomonas sp. BN515 TaxID=2567892 RepID=UPI00245835A7|nr:LysR family transcriptional regulator [Pseudomonas sp. BN515]MDH4871022.1 LysR family transcriptional regulator [Pseudomonas sp. BN515]